MTLSDLEQDVYRRLGKNTTADTATQTRIRAFLNQRQRRILADVGIGQLRDDIFTFASVASQQRYALPQGVSQVHRIWEQTNGRFLRRLSLTDLRRLDPRAATLTGTPDYWVPFGYTAVAKQPADASSLVAVSTSAADTQNLTVEGVTSSGERRTATVALNGLVAVDVAGTISTWVMVERVYVATAAVGRIELHEDTAGGAELARITIGQTAPRYYTILLYPTPSAAVTYFTDAAFEIVDMSVAGDVPYLPPDFHYLISVGARIDEYEKTDDASRLAMAQSEWNEGITKLKWALYGTGDDGPGPTPSNLGPWYPRSTWFS